MSDKEQKNSQADLSGTQQADENKPNVTVIILVSISLIALIIGIAVAYKKKVY